MQVHRTTETTPFDLLLTRHPSVIIMHDSSSAIPKSIPYEQLTPAQIKRVTLRRIRHVLQFAKSKVTKAQERYKANFDRKVRFQVEVKKVNQSMSIERLDR